MRTGPQSGNRSGGAIEVRTRGAPGGSAKPMKCPLGVSSVERGKGGRLHGTRLKASVAAFTLALFSEPTHATAQSGADAFILSEWQRFMSFCGPLFQIDDARFDTLGQIQADFHNKTADGMIASSLSDNEATAEEFLVAKTSAFFSVDCATTRHSGMPASEGKVANTLRDMILASDGMEIIGGQTFTDGLGADYDGRSYYFGVWGGLPQPEAVIWIEVSDGGFSIQGVANVPRMN